MRTLLMDAPTGKRLFDVWQIVPPAGLASVAAYIEDISEIKIIDAKITNLSYETILREIQNYQPDMIGLTLFSGLGTVPTIRLAETIKKVYPEITIVVGGHHATFSADHVLRSGWVDVVVRGEGELTARELWQKRSPEGVLGASYVRDGEIVHNPPRPPVADFATRYPAWHLVDRSLYHVAAIRMEGIESSRGCPYNCTFCSVQKFSGRKWRPRTPESVITEISHLAKTYGTNTIFFLDDNFSMDMERVRKICQLSLDAGLRMRYFCQARVDSFIRAPDVVELMARAGFFLVLLGIENTDEVLLKEVSKGATGWQAEQTVQLLHRHDIAIWGNLMIGFPNETKETMFNTLEAAKHLDLELARFSILTPFPGTDLYEKAQEQDRLLTDEWHLYDTDHAVMRLDNLTTEELYALRKEQYKRYYLRPSYISRHLRPQRDMMRELMLKTLWQGYVNDMGGPDTPDEWIAVFEGYKDLTNNMLVTRLRGQSARILLKSDTGSLVLDVQDGRLTGADTDVERFDCRVTATNDVLNQLLTLTVVDPLSTFVLGMARFDGNIPQFCMVQTLIRICQNAIRAMPQSWQPAIVIQMNSTLEADPDLYQSLVSLGSVRLRTDGLALDLRLGKGKVSYFGEANPALPAKTCLDLPPDVMLSLLVGDFRPFLTSLCGQRAPGDVGLGALLRGIVSLAQQADTTIKPQ
jgi:anaerobic magnesium-protoporphyrin IX monomethyl ester cyclase